MGFWKTLFQVCSGTEVFLRLAECRPGKAFLHLLELMLLLSLLLTWGHSCGTVSEIREGCGKLFAEIGSLRFTPDGIRTARNPDRKQHYLLDDRFRFDYYPGSSLTEEDSRAWTTPFGMIVVDTGLILWMENYSGSGKGRYVIAPLTLEQNPMKRETIRTGLTAGEVYRYLKAGMEHRPGDRKLNFLLPEVNGRQVAEYAVTCFHLMIFLGSLFSMILLTGMSLVFFSVLQYVWGFSYERHLTYRAILSVLIYAAFPALVLSSVYSFFMTSLISPQTVFFAVYFIYDMIVFRRIRLALNPPDETPGDNEF